MLKMKIVDLQGRPFHFIGIGGIGMSALAYILARRQLPVSGSDLRSSHITRRLESEGVHIFNRQEASNLEFFQLTNSLSTPALRSVGQGESRVSSSTGGCLVQEKLPPSLPQVVYSTAIGASNPEYQGAMKSNCPLFHRSDILAALIESYRSIAISGTHGKTTTSSLMGYVLLEAGLDPTLIIGGEVDAWQGNARVGAGDLLVAEADESDGSLIKHSPAIGVVTNIELDHPDHFENLEQLANIFRIFAGQCGTLVGCIDCEVVRQELKPQISYSVREGANADYTVKKVRYHGGGSTAEVLERGQLLGEMNLQLLGTHNLSNALAVVAVARHLGLEFQQIAGAIASFTGAKRRFEERGKSKGITFIDDYAHHPSEILCTLEGARLRVDRSSEEKRVVAIFQPHRYSRTTTFMDEFATAFKNADLVVVTDIYSAGEVNNSGISGSDLADAIAAHHNSLVYHPALQSLSSFLVEILQPGDLTLFLGAGSLNQIIPEVIALCSSAKEQNQAKIVSIT